MRTSEEIVFATPERLRHGREMVITVRDRGSAGNVISKGHRELQECALDVLYRNGRLGPAKLARERFNAGYWLRQLYLKTHPSAGVGAYSIKVETVSGEPEMTEAEAWNFRCYQDTAREMGRHWRILEQVCCEDHSLSVLSALWTALDKLYESREGYISDYLCDEGEAE